MSNKTKRKTKGDKQALREWRERERLLNEQQKSANIRAKYGPTRRPAPVLVRSLTTGEVLRVVEDFPRRREYSEQLNGLARRAGYEDYAAYIQSPYWRAIRERVLERDRRRCILCRSKTRLSVHHDRYDYIGDERLCFLKTICASCHRRIHR